jgi:hypothetical protein
MLSHNLIGQEIVFYLAQEIQVRSWQLHTRTQAEIVHLGGTSPSKVRATLQGRDDLAGHNGSRA